MPKGNKKEFIICDECDKPIKTIFNKLVKKVDNIDPDNLPYGENVTNMNLCERCDFFAMYGVGNENSLMDPKRAQKLMMMMKSNNKSVAENLILLNMFD